MNLQTVPTNIRALQSDFVPNFDEPLQLLVHCHEKIIWQLNNLSIAGELLLSEEKLIEAFFLIDRAAAHLKNAGAKHTEDEENSLFPRLRKRKNSEVVEIFTAIDELEAEHKEAQQIELELNKLITFLPRRVLAAKEKIEKFNEIVARLNKLYLPHIKLENDVVFPFAAKILPESELSEIGFEMKQRRFLV